VAKKVWQNKHLNLTSRKGKNDQFASLYYDGDRPIRASVLGTSTWYRTQEMVVGVLFTTGKRRVSAVLRILGRA